MLLSSLDHMFSFTRRVRLLGKGSSRHRLVPVFQYHNNVCTTKVGRTGLPPKHQIFVMISTKAKGVKRASGCNVRKPSSLAWVSLVIIPRENGKKNIFCVVYRKPSDKTNAPITTSTHQFSSPLVVPQCTSSITEPGYMSIQPVPVKRDAFGFKKMPLPPSTCSQLCDFLRKLRVCTCFVYLDDIIINLTLGNSI